MCAAYMRENESPIFLYLPSMLHSQAWHLAVCKFVMTEDHSQHVIDYCAISRQVFWLMAKIPVDLQDNYPTNCRINGAHCADARTCGTVMRNSTMKFTINRPEMLYLIWHKLKQWVTDSHVFKMLFCKAPNLCRIVTAHFFCVPYSLNRYFVEII